MASSAYRHRPNFKHIFWKSKWHIWSKNPYMIENPWKIARNKGQLTQIILPDDILYGLNKMLSINYCLLSSHVLKYIHKINEMPEKDTKWYSKEEIFTELIRIKLGNSVTYMIGDCKTVIIESNDNNWLK